MQLTFSDDARLELGKIYSYIARDSSNIAKNFISKLTSHIHNLSLFPEMGVLIEEYNIRKLIYRNYIILYQIDYYSNTIYIIKIFNSKQDINIILKEIEKYID